MSELSFLIELLLNHDLPKDTKQLIANRIKEVEEKINKPATISYNTAGYVNQVFPPQAPSTMALMAKHGDISLPSAAQQILPTTVAENLIAQTPATAAAMEARSAIMAGKKHHDELNGRPRKW